MVITPEPQLEAVIRAAAERQGVDPERFALIVLREHFLPSSLPFEPQDDWERGLIAVATNCGVPNPGTTYSSEELYD